MCRVAQSKDTRMDITNLARVFGPTILGHAVPDPDPMTILQDTKRQPKVSDLKWGLGCAKVYLITFWCFYQAFFPSLSFTGGWASLESACGVLESVYVQQQQQPGSKWSHDHRELQCPRDSWSEKYNFHSQALKKKKITEFRARSFFLFLSITCFFFGAVASMFGPITTPDQLMSKTPSSSSLSQRMKNATLNAITPKYVWIRSRSTNVVWVEVN